MDSAKRLSTLELSQKILGPGSTTMQALKKKDSTEEWKILDMAVTFGVSCLVLAVLTTLKHGMAVWGICFSSKGVEGHSSGQPSSTIPAAHAFLILFAVRSWWNLACRASKGPQGLNMSYLPSSYTAGLKWALFTWFLLASEFSLFPELVFRKRAVVALEELSVRCYFWTRLVGWNVEAFRFRTVVTIGAIAGSGLLGFSVAAPLETLQKALLRLDQKADLPLLDTSLPPPAAAQSDSDQNKQKRKDHVSTISSRKLLMGAITMVSSFLFVSFLIPQDPLKGFRLPLTWILLLLIMLPAKVFQQGYLHSAVAEVAGILHDPSFSSKSDNQSSQITHPFSSRRAHLLCHGSQLASLSLLLTLIALTLQLYPGGNAQYPSVYHGRWADQAQLREYWQASAAEDDCCNISSLLGFAAPTICAKQSINTPVPPELTLSSVRKLESESKLPDTSLIESLGQLQSVLKESRQAPGSNSQTDSLKTTLADLQDVSISLAFHPLFTSSVVRPLADFLLFLLTSSIAISCSANYLQLSSVK